VIKELRRNSISLLAFIKRFRFIGQSEQDVLIEDDEGSDSIKYCIPNKVTQVFSNTFSFSKYILDK
jgi:hypothetical protein